MATNNKEDQLIVPDILRDDLRGEQYKVKHILGKGGFATVYQVVELSSGRTYACKITSQAQLQRKKHLDKFQTEIRIHKQLRHPNICQLINVFSDTNNYYMIMELCDAGSLSHFIKGRLLHEEEIQQITLQLINGQQYLKSLKIVHRDLKPQNIFLQLVQNKIVAKIGDFGLSAQTLVDEKRYTLCGTPNFLPPETLISHVFRRRQQAKQVDNNIDQETVEIVNQMVQNNQSLYYGHDYQADMWSIGCIVYQLCCGKPPFETNSICSTYKRILKCQFNQQVIKNQFLKDFICRCLVINPSSRLSIEEAKQHPFMLVVKLKYLPMDALKLDYFTYNCRYDDLYEPGTYDKTIVQIIQQNMTSKQTVFQLMIQDLYPEFQILGQKIDFTQYFPTISIGNLLDSQITQKLLPTDIPQNAPIVDYDLFIAKCQHNVLFPQSTPKIYIQNYPHILYWQDFTTQYGMNYVFNNGSSGEFFNDATFLIESPNGLFYDYFDRTQWHRIRAQFLHEVVCDKKIKLHKYFKQRLEPSLQQKRIVNDSLDVLLDVIWDAIYKPLAQDSYIERKVTQMKNAKSYPDLVYSSQGQIVKSISQVDEYTRKFTLQDQSMVAVVAHRYILQLLDENKEVSQLMTKQGFFSLASLAAYLTDQLTTYAINPLPHLRKFNTKRLGYAIFGIRINQQQVYWQMNFPDHTKLIDYEKNALIYNENRQCCIVQKKDMERSNWDAEVVKKMMRQLKEGLVEMGIINTETQDK
ncbi:Serine/threonine-protein_kinase PLK [Hexamita inflata]|uniref:Serine/threonine-protein kinase PLK n=1 Tax=Hexamita inflata TaxID=28002 RepID=A0AA86R550_9EUKA|nr:Serine/threonine-protein kinase PLK [Hexamita inflata]